MNKEIAVNEQKQGFPWDAAVLFLVVGLLTGVYASWMALEEVPEVNFSVVNYLTAGLITVVGLCVALAFQYALIRFPVQWMAKQKEIYKMEIVSSLLYSGSIMLVIGILLMQFNLEENPIISLIQTILGAVLFLMLYISGEEKEPEVKRAVIIVQVAILVIGQLLTMLTNNLPTPV